MKFTENRVFNRSRRLRGVRSSYLNRILMKIYSFSKPYQIWYFEKFAFYYSSNFKPFCCFSQWYIAVFSILNHKRVKTYFIWMFCGVISKKQYPQNFIMLSFVGVILSFTKGPDLSFYHFIILSFYHFIILSFTKGPTLSFYHFIILGRAMF